VSVVQLPSHFVPTHETAGLPGFPAIDVFAPAHTIVCSPATGRIVKLSGHAPTPTAKPGGPYGWSIYLTVDKAHLPPSGGTFYLTHFGTRSPLVQLGVCVGRGEVLGIVADYSHATGGTTPDHIHEGFHRGAWQPPPL